ncbi:MAG: hypothetical protein ACT4OJ_14275 [Bacteroidota bacterium]
MDAQKFMNLHGLTECFECDGDLYKRQENAEARKVSSGKEVITHQLSAGARKKGKPKEEGQPNNET